MLADLCISRTVKIMGPGRPLNEAGRTGDPDACPGCTALCHDGIHSSLPGIPEKEPDELSGSRGIFLHGAVSVNGCGIFPVATGTAWGFTAHSCIRNNLPASGA